jgi:cell wall-associated NlpC family hydrolase
MGVPIPRDADQQFLAGKPVESAQPGDLVFFGDPPDDVLNRPAHVTHVAISLGGDEIIHANGGSWNTAYNSLAPNSPIYRADLRESFMGVRRMTND